MTCVVNQVTMSDRLAAERACKDANPIIDGRKANVNLAYLGAKPRGNLQAGKMIPSNLTHLALLCRRVIAAIRVATLRKLNSNFGHVRNNDVAADNGLDR